MQSGFYELEWHVEHPLSMLEGYLHRDHSTVTAAQCNIQESRDSKSACGVGRRKQKKKNHATYGSEGLWITAKKTKNLKII